MKKLALILLLTLFVASCSSDQKTKTPTQNEEENFTGSEEVLSIPHPEETRKPLYIINEKDELLPIVTLSFYGEPQLLSAQGYGRLVGVIGEEKLRGLIEINGKACIVNEGSIIGNYMVSKIFETKIILTKSDGNINK